MVITAHREYSHIKMGDHFFSPFFLLINISEWLLSAVWWEWCCLQLFIIKICTDTHLPTFVKMHTDTHLLTTIYNLLWFPRITLSLDVYQASVSRMGWAPRQDLLGSLLLRSACFFSLSENHASMTESDPSTWNERRLMPLSEPQLTCSRIRRFGE